MSEPRWLLDGMLGRLARHLRFVGHDTAYAPDTSDDDLIVRAIRESRILVTRDRTLAARSAPSLLLRSVDIRGQWREVREAYPALPWGVVFDRCSRCNSSVAPGAESGLGELPATVPMRARNGAIPVFRCPACGHLYWEGSHTAHIRQQHREWGEGGAP